MMRSRRQYLQQHDINDGAAQFALSLSLRNACAFFFDDRQTMYRSQLVTQSETGDEMVLHGFNERSTTYLRLTSVRPSGKYERNALRRCSRQPLGIGVPVSQVNSVYHQMFHAVPTWAAQHQRVADQVATFVPLAFASAAIGRGKPANIRRWHGWEFSLRALTSRTPEEIASTTA